MQAQKLKIAPVGFFIAKGIKSYYNYKQKPQAHFSHSTTCNQLPQRQALRFAVSNPTAGVSFRFAKRYALASATNNPTADGVGAWVGIPERVRRKRLAPSLKSGAFSAQGTPSSGSFFVLASLRSPVRFRRFGQAVRQNFVWLRLLAPSRAPEIGCARSLPASQTRGFATRFCPPPNPEGGNANPLLY